MLGVAHYRASNWQSAVDALRKSMDIRNSGDGFVFLYLAMAQWQLGEKGEARRRYDRVVDWINMNNPKSDSLTRLRNEAAERLGVNEKK
jgi:Flp pilus assembly protein TadD